MIGVQTADAIRVAEQVWFEAHRGEDLMGRAAAAVAAHALEMAGTHGRVLVVVGRGNNGGDGLFAAAELARRGLPVAIWPVAGTMHEQGRVAATGAGCRFVGVVEATEQVAEVDLVVDAVLGIGGRPGLRPEVLALAQEAEALGVPVLAVDLPSGLDTDSHQLQGSFHATRTITFAARKACHVLQPAASRCGEVVCVDIGIELGNSVLEVAEAGDVAVRWPVPGPTSDKYSRGVVGIDSGSAQYSGAAVLGVTGALYAGAGMIRFVGPEPADAIIRASLPSVTHGEGRVQAWLCGSGWGSADDNRARLERRLADGVPAVIDADALSVLPEHLPYGCLLTPHAGELARLLGAERAEVEADPIGSARRAAERTGAVVLLKGASQYIVQPDGRVQVAVPGPSWTAQAGSGDVLAGICATLLAAGLPAADAGLVGASVQAMAAARRPGPWPPDDIAHEVAALVGNWGELSCR